MPEESNEESAIQSLKRALDKLIEAIVVEAVAAWDTLDRALGELFQLGNLIRLFSLGGAGVASFFDQLVDAFADFAVALRNAPVKAIVRLGVMEIPLPQNWHQRAIALDDGVRLGMSIFASAGIDILTNPSSVLYRFVDSMASRFRLLRFLRTIPDFDPVEGGNILRSKVAKAIVLLLEAFTTFLGFIFLALCIFATALAANDPVLVQRALTQAFPQDSRREKFRGAFRSRINLRKGPDQ